MYNVVFRNIVPGIHFGVRTRSAFQSEEEFKARYDNHMKTLCAVVAPGVTEERAIELCAEANRAAVTVFFALGSCD